MKILFDYNIFSHQKLGGISRYFLNLHKYINKHPQIYCKIFAPIHLNKFLNTYEKGKGFNFYLKNYPKYTRKLINIINLNSSKIYCKNFKPNIIHKTFFNHNFENNFKIKKIITVYDLIHEIYYRDFKKSEGYLPKKDFLKNVDFIICPSNKTKDDLMHFYNVKPEKIKVIYMGINKFDDVKELEFLKKLKPFLLYVGDRKRYKNFRNLIIALSLKTNILNDFNLICLGGGNFSNTEKELFKKHKIKENKIIQLEGDDNVLFNLYKNAKAFIFPSTYEGLGLPQLEAMSLGCPVISSNHEAIVEAVDNAAELFNPHDPEDIINVIDQTLYSENKLNDLKKRGLERSKLFSLEKCANETLDLYKLISG